MEHDTQNRIVQQLDRIEEKLDGHLERITAAEADIRWLRGSVKVALAAILSVVGTVLAAAFNYIWSK